MLNRLLKFSITTLKHTALLFSLVATVSGCFFAPIATTAELLYNRHKIANYVNNIHHASNLQHSINHAGLLKNNRIKFSETDNKILIYGQIANAEALTNINRIVQNNSDNKVIFNQLELKKPISVTQILYDSWITTKLKSQFILDNKTDLSDIKIITDDNIVYLMGNVNSLQEEEAIKVAQSVDGIKKIVKIFSKNS